MTPSAFFFTEGGSFLFLRDKAQEALEAGDVTMLCLLAEGFGYWRGATEAHERASAYYVRSLDPGERPCRPPPPLSFFAKLADPADDPRRLSRAKAEEVAFRLGVSLVAERTSL